MYGMKGLDLAYAQKQQVQLYVPEQLARLGQSMRLSARTLIYKHMVRLIGIPTIPYKNKS